MKWIKLKFMVNIFHPIHAVPAWPFILTCFVITGNIPLPKREERSTMLEHSEFWCGYIYSLDIYYFFGDWVLFKDCSMCLISWLSFTACLQSEMLRVWCVFTYSATGKNKKRLLTYTSCVSMFHLPPMFCFSFSIILWKRWQYLWGHWGQW